jgi:hypothetical protein
MKLAAIFPLPLAAYLLSAWPSVAIAAGVAVWGEPLESSVSRILDRPDLAVVVATRANADALEVVEVLHGEAKPGTRLAFDDCARLLIIGSTVELLRELTAQAPVLDAPPRNARTVDLPGDRSWASYPPPEADARYLVFLSYRPGADSWGFANQTYGDFFLLAGATLFRRSYLQSEGLTGNLWVPVFPQTSPAAFLDLVAERLAAAP